MTIGHELAQMNIALAREPLDAPLLADFMAALDPVNAQAGRAAGFMWRMQSDDGDATALARRADAGHQRAWDRGAGPA